MKSAIKKLIQLLPNKFILFCLRYLYWIWRVKNREFNPRYWSNDELKKFAHQFPGAVINVSAGEDKDKEKGDYKNYFTAATSYTISNYQKVTSDPNELELDLSVPISRESKLISQFDVVFTHTVLEHIYDVKTSVANLCLMSKDIVITVIPFLQTFHHLEAVYNDYWRISPYALIHLFQEHQFHTIYLSWNNDPIGNIYLFHIASRHPEKWEKISKMNSYNVLKAPGYFRQTLLANKDYCEAVMIYDLSKIM